MTTRIRTSIASAVTLASVGALVISTPSISAQLDMSTASIGSQNSLSTPFELLSKKSDWQGGANAGYYDDDESDDDGDDDHGSGNNDGDDDGGGIGGIGNFVADFLANNQAEVLAVTAMIPVFYLGPVAVGNSLLATAYYSGYNGSAAGLEGVVSYVTSQIGVPSADLVQTVVLGLTALVPQFNIGPVAVGNSLLATAYFDGYNGSATGLPGVISYVTSQLGVQVAPGAAVSVSPAAAAAAAVPLSVSAPQAEPEIDSAPSTVTVSRQAVAAPAAAQDRAEITEAIDADAEVSGATSSTTTSNTTTSNTAGRPESARGSASAKAGSAHSKARSERSAAKAADGQD